MVIAAADVFGDGCVRSALPEPDTCYVESLLLYFYLSRVGNCRVAGVGSMADSRGSRKPSRSTVIRFLEARGKSPSASARI